MNRSEHCVDNLESFESFSDGLRASQEKDAVELYERYVRSFLDKEFKQIKREQVEMLHDYTRFLCKWGYTDSDVYVEEPKAVDRYLATLADTK